LAPSNSSDGTLLLDRVALCSLASGLALYVVPWWREGRLSLAFWLTFVATLLHVYTSHQRARTEGEA
jgi:hypothetical protein